MARLGVVLNPAANGHRGRVPGSGVIAELRAAGHTVDDLTGTSAADSAHRAHTATHSPERLDGLVVVGGDGMVHLGVNAVAQTSVPLGLIAIGSGNDFARTLGLPLHDARAGLAVVHAALARPARSLDLLQVRHEGNTRWVAGVISAGLDAAVNESANRYTFPPGGGKYIRAVAANLRQFRPYGYRLTIDGVATEFTGTLIAIANAPYFGGGMRMAPEAGLDDGLADIVLARELTRTQIVRVFPRLYTGSHIHHPAVRLERGKQITLAPLPGAPAPPAAYGDGERLGPLPMTVTIAPGALSMLCPDVP